jgi:hypothetical protein
MPSMSFVKAAQQFHKGMIAQRVSPSKDAGILPSIPRALGFSDGGFVAEARERLKEIVTKVFSPASLDDLNGYVQSKGMRLTTRSLRGTMTNYLQDVASGRTAPAALVSETLSFPHLRKVFGYNPVPAFRDRAALSAQAIILKDKLMKPMVAENLRDLLGTAVETRDELSYRLATMTGLGNEDGILSVEVRRSNIDGQNRTTAYVRRGDDRLNGALVNLTEAGLTRQTGQTADKHMADSASRRRASRAFSGPTGGDNVVDFASISFLKQAQAVAKGVEVKMVDDPNGGFSLEVWRLDPYEKSGMDPSELAPGLYRKVSPLGDTIGRIMVGEDGSIQHLANLNGRWVEHNEYGPSFVPKPGSTLPLRYKLQGNEVSEADVMERHRSNEAPEPELAAGGRPFGW